MWLGGFVASQLRKTTVDVGLDTEGCMMVEVQIKPLPKAPWLRVRWVRNGWTRPLVMGVRIANAYSVFVGPVQITWRRPWLYHVARVLHPECFARRSLDG